MTLSAPAWAASPSKEEAAKAHYNKGAQLYRQADYAGAWLEFTSAYQLLSKTELLFNMARCEVRLGRPADALAHFQTYLEGIPNDPDAEGIRKEIEQLKIEVGLIKKRESERRPSPAEATPAAPVKEAPQRPWPVYGTVAGAGTILLGVIGIALVGSVSSQYGRLQDQCAPNCRPEEVRPLEQQAAAGYAFLGLAGAGLIATTALLVWELRRPIKGGDRLRGAVVPQQRSLALGWRF